MFCSDLTETVDWASNTNDDAPLYQVWSQNVQNFRWLFCLRIWTYSVTLTLKIRTQTFQMTIPVMMMHQHIKFHSERLSGTWFRIYCPDKFSHRIWTLTVTLTLSTAVPNCHKTPRLMMMHHYIIIIPSLVAKSLEVQGIWKKVIFEDLSQYRDRDLKVRTQLFCTTFWVMMVHDHTKFWSWRRV